RRPDGKDFRRHECISGQRGAGDAGAGSDWNYQYYAGRGCRPYAGDWLAQGAGSDECEHHVSVFRRGRVSDLVEWSDRNWRSGGIDGAVVEGFAGGWI